MASSSSSLVVVKYEIVTLWIFLQKTTNRTKWIGPDHATCLDPHANLAIISIAPPRVTSHIGGTLLIASTSPRSSARLSRWNNASTFRVPHRPRSNTHWTPFQRPFYRISMEFACAIVSLAGRVEVRRPLKEDRLFSPILVQKRFFSPPSLSFFFLFRNFQHDFRLVYFFFFFFSTRGRTFFAAWKVSIDLTIVSFLKRQCFICFIRFFLSFYSFFFFFLLLLRNVPDICRSFWSRGARKIKCVDHWYFSIAGNFMKGRLRTTFVLKKLENFSWTLTRVW